MASLSHFGPQKFGKKKETGFPPRLAYVLHGVAFWWSEFPCR